MACGPYVAQSRPVIPKARSEGGTDAKSTGETAGQTSWSHATGRPYAPRRPLHGPVANASNDYPYPSNPRQLEVRSWSSEESG